MTSPSQPLERRPPYADEREIDQAPGQMASTPAVAPTRWPWSARRTAFVMALWGIGAAVFALLTFAAYHAGPFPGDIGVEQWVQQLRSSALVSFVNFASDANWPKPAGITAIVVIVLLALARQIRAAISAAFAGFGADFVNVTVNGIAQRPRPHGDHIHTVANLGLYSYPSGHVTHVIAFYGFLLYLTLLAGRARPALRPLLWIVRIASIYFIIFVGPARIWLGAHWPSDVLASYLLGALMLVAGIALFHLLGMLGEWFHERHLHERSHVAAI